MSIRRKLANFVEKHGTQQANLQHKRTCQDAVSQADIDKHVTFHTARHSYATMALMVGADIYTISIMWWSNLWRKDCCFTTP